MIRRLDLAFCSLVLGCALLQPAAAVSEFEDIAIAASNSVHLQRDTTVTGDVAVDAASPGPVLSAGVELDVDRGAVVNGSLSADSIDLSNNTTVDGDVNYNELIDRGAAITGDQNTPLPLPVFTSFPVFQQAVVRPEPASPHSPGQGEDVFVPAKTTVTLFAGDYGDITIEGGGAGGGTLLLRGGGVFNVRSIGFSSGGGGQCGFPCRSIQIDAATDLRVIDRVDVERNAHVGPADGAAVGAAQFLIYVGGANGGTGGPLAAPPAVGIGRTSIVEASVYAPNGTILVEQFSSITGALIARDVKIDRGTTVVEDTGFGNKPPTANPQTVFTNGASPVVITLTGSDPEQKDLEFSIVENQGPFAGMLGTITPIVPAPINGFDREGNPIVIQPPITSATVTYTPNGSDDVEDFFTFKVTDDCGDTGLAVVTINPVDGTPPVPPLDVIVASDEEIDVVVGNTVEIMLQAGAPDGVTLKLSITSLPGAGTLADSLGNDIGPMLPYELPDATVFYTAGAVPGADSFTFVAEDTAPVDPLASATGTVFIGINDQILLAEDQTVLADVGQPVLFTLSGNPGGAVPVVKTLKALPGADIAGNVSDANGDGLGDGRDNLPGPAPVLIAAGVDVNLGATPSGSVTDPAGDATDDTRVDPDPDLVSATAASDGTNLTLSVRFVPSSFSSATSRGSFVLDTDENPATGFPGIDAANNDSALMGVEYLVNIGSNLGAFAEVLQFVSLPNNFTSLGTFPATVLADGYDVSIPLVTLGGDDGRMKFKAETQSHLGGGGFTGILDYAPDVGLAPGQSRTGIQGVARIQIEWDISGLVIGSPEDIESATVTLYTEKGTVDDLDTMFYAGTEDGDGLLTVDDFETEADEIVGVVMPAPIGVPTGTEGTFSFGVTSELRDAVDAGLDFFTIQGRVEEDLAGGGFRRGLQVRSTATGNLNDGEEPQLEIVTEPDPGPALVWTITSLPQAGTVRTSSGSLVTVGQTFLASPTMTYTAAAEGTESLGYRVTQGNLFRDVFVNFVVSFNDLCTPVGRPPGCAPQ